MLQNIQKILIIDDIYENIEFPFIYLTDKGYEVDYALNGQDGIDKINNNNFDLILLDVMMPKLDGFQVCKLVKSNKDKAEIPIIFLTALHDSESVIHGFELGAVDYLTKPINIKELDIRIKTHLELRFAKLQLKQTIKELNTKNNQLISKNNQITESLNYATRIQQAALPDKELLDTFLREYFIIYKPKNIVSGDFFWVKQFDNKAIIVVSDCTGHGVPGGFLSMLGLSFLNEIVFNLSEIVASEILKIVNKKLDKMLRNNTNITDGMDMSVAVLNYESKILQFAGINSIIAFYLRNNYNNFDYNDDIDTITIDNDRKITSIKGKKVIREFINPDIEILNFDIPLKTGDIVYMFTDGIYDQFDSKEHNRYTKKKLLEKLAEIAELDLKIQKQILEIEHDKWKGNSMQIDDITLLAFKIQDEYGSLEFL